MDCIYRSWVALQRNELLVLQYLAKNARSCDSAIAEEIGISTQAVGKIRKRLEAEGVIQGYNLRLDPAAIGLGVVVITQLRLPPDILAQEDAFRANIVKEPHVIDCYRLPHGDAHIMMVCAFTTLLDKEESLKAFAKRYPGVHAVSMQTSTWDSVWKNTKKDAYLYTLRGGHAE